MYELRGFFPRDASKLQPEWIVSILEPRAFFPRGTLLNKAANRMDCFHSGAAWILSTWRFRAEHCMLYLHPIDFSWGTTYHHDPMG